MQEETPTPKRKPRRSKLDFIEKGISIQEKVAADELTRQVTSGKRPNMTLAAARASLATGEHISSSQVSKMLKDIRIEDYMLMTLADAGITDDSLATMLAEDLASKPGNRLGEMKFAAELMGRLGSNKTSGVSTDDKATNVINIIKDLVVNASASPHEPHIIDAEDTTAPTRESSETESDDEEEDDDDEYVDFS